MTEPARRVRPRRTALGCLGGLVLLLLLALLAAEVALRVDDWRAGRDADFYLPHQDFSEAMYEVHPYLGLVHRPGFDRRAPPPGSEGQRNYQAHINALGLRGPETTRSKPAGTYRILCLGGSTTFGTGATSDANTYPARLQEILNRMAAEGRVPAGRSFEVLNGGVSGYNTADSLIDLALRGVELHPDAVLVYHAGNDARMIQARDFVPDFSHLRRPPPVLEISGLERFLLRHVRTYARLARGTDPEEQIGALANLIFVPDFEKKIVSSSVWINADGLAVFRRNLREIAAVAHSAGASVVFETFAGRDTDSDGGRFWSPVVTRANEEIRSLGQEIGVPVCPTAETLNGQAALYDDWMHFNDTGELQHARVVADFALQNGLLGTR